MAADKEWCNDYVDALKYSKPVEEKCYREMLEQEQKEIPAAVNDQDITNVLMEVESNANAAEGTTINK